MDAFKSYFYAARPEKHESTVLVDSTPPSPPPEKIRTSTWSWKKPRTWGKKTYAAIVLIIAAIVVAIVVPVVVTKKHNGYPDYYRINYSLSETWTGSDFFNHFDYFTAADPTQGFVTYVGPTIAASQNLTSSTNSTATIRVDTSTANATRGRDSIRLVSKNGYNRGLFIFDVQHVPVGCATWPAIWMTALSGWPYTGEIDIMETVNQGGPNQMTLHTSQDCSMDGFRNQTGTTLTTDCYVGPSNGDSCAVMGSAKSAGSAFNSNGGGVYAMEWRYEGIRIWFFERGQIPSNINSPDPSVWGLPSADFPNTNCNIGSHFTDLHVVTNIALCGVWAGADDVYYSEDHCPNTCTGYVATNATAFSEAYFTFNSFKIYTGN